MEGANIPSFKRGVRETEKPMFGVELNLSPTSDFDKYNTDTLERICQRNLKMLSAGKQPTFVLIGVAESATAARHFVDSYKAAD
jgi:hypothetical protein